MEHDQGFLLDCPLSIRQHLIEQLTFHLFLSIMQSVSLLKGTFIVGILTLVSRILGFVRELLIARLFGTSWIADSYFVAFRIPNLLRSIFGEGALSSAFVPVFSESIKSGNAKALLREIVSLLTFATILVSLFGILYSEEIVSLIAPGFVDPSSQALTISLTQIMFPYIIFVSIVVLINAALNAKGIFGISGFAQIIMNLTLVIGALIAHSYESTLAASILGYSVLLGGILQVLFQIPTLSRQGLSLIPIIRMPSREALLFLSLMIPGVIGACVYQLTIFVTTNIASLLPEGGVSALSYADRIVQLPIGIFSIALSSVLLPTLSRAKVENDSDTFASSLRNAIRFTTFFLVPCSFLFILTGKNLLHLLFQRGAFNGSALDLTFSAVCGLSIGIWGVSVQSLAVRGFHASKDTKTPVLISLGTLCVTTFLALLFVQLEPHSYLYTVSEWIKRFFHVSYDLGIFGLSLSSSLSFTLSGLLTLFLVSQKHSISYSYLLSGLGSTVIASSLSFLCAYLLSAPLGAVALIESLILFLLTFLFIQYILKSDELKDTVALLYKWKKSKQKT